MKVHSFSTYTLASNSYVLSSEGEYAIIDPSIPYDDIITKLPEKDIAFKYIILTHAHFDHMLHINEWKEKTGAEVIVGQKDRDKLSDSYQNCYQFFFGKNDGYRGTARAVSEGEELSLGKEKLKIYESPGHTSGSILILFGENLFVGDTVFADGGIGRTDLPSGNTETLFRSIERIRSFPKHLSVYSGHGRKTSIKEINQTI